MDDTTKLKIFKALADQTRLEIVRTIASGTCAASCSDVSRNHALSQPAMSHHLNKLVEAGVLLDHKDGTQKYYKINTPLLTTAGIDPRKL